MTIYNSFSLIDIQQGALHSEALSSLPESHRGGEEVESLFRPPSFLSDLPSWSTDREEVLLNRHTKYHLLSSLYFRL